MLIIVYINLRLQYELFKCPIRTNLTQWEAMDWPFGQINFKFQFHRKVPNNRCLSNCFFFSLCVRTITFQWKFVVVIVKVSQSTAKEVLVPLWTIHKVLNSIADHLIVGWLILHLCVSVCLFCRFWFDHRRKGYDLCLDLKWSVRLIEVIDLWGKGFTVMDS